MHPKTAEATLRVVAFAATTWVGTWVMRQVWGGERDETPEQSASRAEAVRAAYILGAREGYGEGYQAAQEDFLRNQPVARVIPMQRNGNRREVRASLSRRNRTLP